MIDALNTILDYYEGGMKMSVLENFDSWKGFLANRLEQAKSGGMSEEAISNVAYEVGDYLAQSVDVKNDEAAVLKELWNVASKEEQQAIANSMVKLVQNEGK